MKSDLVGEVFKDWIQARRRKLIGSGGDDKKKRYLSSQKTMKNR